jgi:biofilm PGA synthesis protein PgaD
MTHTIIDRPELQSRGQRWLFSLLTAALWSFYLYLLLPLVSAFAWWMGYNAIYQAMVVDSGWETLLSMVGVYAVIIAVIGTVQIVWALGNWLRFSGERDRRRERAPSMDAEFVQPLFMTDTQEFPAWQNAKRLTVHLHQTLPRIIAVEAG